MHILLVTNPVARRNRPHLTRWIADQLSDVAKVRVVPTTHRNHATEIAVEAADAGVDAVVALGGDGTVNEVLQGIAGTRTRLAALPGGSTNVYTRILGMPRSLVGSTSILKEALEQDRTRPVPAGRANDRWFAWCAGFGYDAEIVQEVERHPRIKRSFGQLSFIGYGWGSRLKLRDVAIRVEAGPARPAGRREEAAPSMTVGGGVVACNADPYTYFGPLASRMCPEATLERGLDLTALGDLSLRTVASDMRKALTGRDVRSLPQVTGWHDRAWYDLTTDHPLAVHTDGDPAGLTQHLRLEVVPDAVRLCA